MAKMQEIPIVERAFQLAPNCSTFRDLQAAMKREGYSRASLDSYLAGRAIREQLKSRYRIGNGASSDTDS